jgi:hypothetical protein
MKKEFEAVPLVDYRPIDLSALRGPCGLNASRQHIVCFNQASTATSRVWSKDPTTWRDMPRTSFVKEDGDICKRVHFGSINWEEEDQRTARGVELRREREELTNMADRNRDNRIQATLEIIRDPRCAASLIRFCNGNRFKTLLNLFLDNYVAPNERMTGMTAFRRLPQNRTANLTQETENLLLFLASNCFLW